MGEGAASATRLGGTLVDTTRAVANVRHAVCGRRDIPIPENFFVTCSGLPKVLCKLPGGYFR